RLPPVIRAILCVSVVMLTLLLRSTVQRSAAGSYRRSCESRRDSCDCLQEAHVTAGSTILCGVDETAQATVQFVYGTAKRTALDPRTRLASRPARETSSHRRAGSALCPSGPAPRTDAAASPSSDGMTWRNGTCSCRRSSPADRAGVVHR